MKRRLFSFLIAFIGLFAVAAVVETVRNQAASAEETIPVDGNLYRIVNAGYGHAMTASGAGNITAADPNDDDAQLWLAVANPGGGFYLRNYKTGYYLTSSRRRSAPWQAEFTVTPDPDKTLLTFIPDDGTCFIHTLNGYGRTDDEGTHGFAHEDGGKKVVGWNTNSVNTRWKLIRQTTVTPEMIAARKKTWASCVSEILPGKAYRIRNYSYGHNLAPDGDRLSGRTPDENDPSQIWIVERNPAGEGYVLRNFDSGKIVTSSCQASQRWTLRDIYLPDPEKCVMQF
ncbi:MAG: RICIN domain-containing protein, partial [Muribaculaceae bacterium]|nr:RICIN domain-containing protein [Muribaculaceae bacterium]